MNLLGYTLYTVDLAGNRRPGSMARCCAPPSSSRRAPCPTIVNRSFTRRSSTWRERPAARALINARSTEPFAATVADTRSYYWLGFVPDRQGDDRSHVIKVSVGEPGLEVRSRGDYFDYSPGRELSLAVESALLFGSPLGPQPLEVRVGAPEDRARGRMMLPLTLVVPVDAVAIQPEAGEYVARLELRVAAIDEHGDSSEVPVIPVTLRSSDRAGAGVDPHLHHRASDAAPRARDGRGALRPGDRGAAVVGARGFPGASLDLRGTSEVEPSASGAGSFVPGSLPPE